MNDMKQRITSQNILSIIDEEAIKHLSSLRGTSRKQKDELVHSSVCIKKSITPHLNPTHKVKKSNDGLINISSSLNNVTKFNNQPHIETKSKAFKSEHKKNSHNKPKIPISTNQTAGNTAINIIKLDNLSNSFFNTKTSSTKSNNAMHMSAKKKLFNLSFSKEHNYKSLNNNYKNNNNDVHSLCGTNTKYSPHHNSKAVNVIHHKRYLSSRQNSNDIPTRSDSISNNNCQKNIDQTFAFSPLQKVVTKNRSFHTNEQNECNNNANTNHNTNNNNNINNNIIPYHAHHNDGKKKVNKNYKLHKSKTKKIGNINDNQKDAKKKNQAFFLIDDKHNNNKNNNNINKGTNQPKNEELSNKKIENIPTSESPLKIHNKQCFLCCIPLFKSKHNKQSSP